MLAQAESVIVMGTAATYSEELASCFEDANQEQALHQLRGACRKTLTTVKPVTSSEASKARDFWPALHRLSAALRNTLKSVSDGNQLSDQIFDPLKPENGFEDSAKFASGAHKALRIHFWEMVISHVETIEEALARVHF